MALAHRASAKPTATNNTTSCTITIPASVQADDLLFVATVNRGATADPTVTDNDTGGNVWAKVTGTDNNGASGDLWWKRATSGSASKTVTISGCTTSCSSVLSAFSGGKTTDPPYENAAAQANNSGVESHAGFTPSENGSMICLATFQVQEDEAVSTQSSTDPGALAELIEHINNAGGGGSNHSGTAIASALQATANATGNLTWAQTNRITISVGWNILPASSVTQVNQDLELVWDVDELATQDLGLVWDVDELAGQDLGLVWNVYMPFYEFLYVRWNVDELATSDLSLPWNVSGLVDSDLSLVWGMSELVDSDLSLVWDVYAPAGADAALVWNVGQLANSDLSLLWDVSELISSDLELQWNSSMTVSGDLSLLWGLNQLIASDLEMLWRVRGAESVTASLGLPWSISSLVQSDLALSWSLNGLATGNLSLIWGVRVSAYNINGVRSVLYSRTANTTVYSTDARAVSLSGRRTTSAASIPHSVRLTEG